ncbi:MAG: hypothetical protein AAGB24_14990, partial [Bacteroidota bacterium]
MANETTAADAFHQGMVELISRSYGRQSVPIAPGEVVDPVREGLRSSLAVWEGENTQWPHPAYDLGVPTDAYRSALTGSIKATLDALRGFLEHSAIFSEEEKGEDSGAYQDLMSVLATPENPKAIAPGDQDRSGLFYRDMVHNDRYWDTTGGHIQLMRELSGTIAEVAKICTGNDLVAKRGDVQSALSTIFTSELSAYGVCLGGHASKIRDARDLLRVSPEAVLLSHWNAYVKGLMLERPPGGRDVPIANAIPMGEQVHLPPAVDHLVGVPKGTVVQRDSLMFNGFTGLTMGHHCFLADRAFDFPKTLAKKLGEDIRGILQDFDNCADLAEKNHRAEQLVGLLRPFVADSAIDGFRYGIYDMERNTFASASHIEEESGKVLAGSLCATVGMAEVPFQALVEQDVSAGKRAQCIPREGIFFGALFLAYALTPREGALGAVIAACPEGLKGYMFATALYDCALQGNDAVLNRVVAACPEGLKGNTFIDTLYYCALQDNRDTLDRVVAACPEGLKGSTFTTVLYRCAEQGNMDALDRVVAACPEGLKDYMFTTALYYCALQGNDAVLNRVVAACP